jgi:hypothetical protein
MAVSSPSLEKRPKVSITDVSEAIGKVKLKSHGTIKKRSFNTAIRLTPLFITRFAICMILPMRKANVNTTSDIRNERRNSFSM